MDLSRHGFSHDEIIKALHSSNRQVDFRYDLLNKQNQYLRTLANVSSASVKQDMRNQVKGTAKFTITEDGIPIDYLSDRIKPYMRLYIPPSPKKQKEYAFFSHIQTVEVSANENERLGGWADFPLGVYLLSSPTRREEIGSVQRDIEAYDLSLILRDDKFTERHSILEGESFYSAIVSLLTGAGITQYNIEQTDKVLPRTIEFEPGVEKLLALNELLAMINYTPIFVDSEGYFVSRLYVPPVERPVDYVYFDDENSVIRTGVEENLDSMNISNVFSVVMTNEEEKELVSTYINDNPNSPTSTVNRGRQIVERRTIDNIADQESLDAYVQRIAIEANQVYGSIPWNSSLMPFHGYANVLQFRYQNLDISGKYLELSWEMELKVGGNMQHELRQVISL